MILVLSVDPQEFDRSEFPVAAEVRRVEVGRDVWVYQVTERIERIASFDGGVQVTWGNGDFTSLDSDAIWSVLP